MKLPDGGVAGPGLALGLMLALALLVWASVLEPLWREYQSRGEAIEEAREYIPRYLGLAARARSAGEQLRALTDKDSVADFALRERSATLAAAALQEHVKRVAAQASAKLSSTQSLPVKSGELFDEVRVSVRLSGSVEGLLEVLHGLEGGTPLLRVEDLNVQVRRSRVRRREPRTVTPMKLDIRFVVLGYLPRVEGAA